MKTELGNSSAAIFNVYEHIELWSDIFNEQIKDENNIKRAKILQEKERFLYWRARADDGNCL